MSFLENPAFHQLNIFDSFSETNPLQQKKKKTTTQNPSLLSCKVLWFYLKRLRQPYCEGAWVIPARFWGSFGLFPWVLWGRAPCLYLVTVTVAVNQVPLGTCASHWQGGLERAGMEVCVLGVSFVQCVAAVSSGPQLAHLEDVLFLLFLHLFLSSPKCPPSKNAPVFPM